MLHSSDYRHTLRTCNTYFFSTATVVTRKRINVTFICTVPLLFIDTLREGCTLNWPTCMHVCMYVCTHKCMHMCVCVCACVSVCVCEIRSAANNLIWRLNSAPIKHIHKHDLAKQSPSHPTVPYLTLQNKHSIQFSRHSDR
jgi:hypothetical protein